MASMFDTIADMLRGSAPDDLAHALGTDRTHTRRAMEIGLPALITGLRDKTLEPGGASSLAGMLADDAAQLPTDVGAYLGEGDPSRGAAMLDVAFGDRGEPALSALAGASGLSTRLLAQVMSVLAPLATGVLAEAAPDDADGLRSYLAGAVDDLEGKGFGRVVELVSPAGPLPVAPTAEAEVLETPEVAEVIDVSGPAELDVVIDDYVDDDVDGVPDGGLELVDTEPLVEATDTASELAVVEPLGTVVEGAFPTADDATEQFGIGSIADVDDLDQVDIESIEDVAVDAESTLGADVAFNVPEAELPDVEVPDFGPASVVPDVGFGDVDADTAVTSVLVDEAPIVEPNVDYDDGNGLSAMGWLWWLIGAILAVLLALFLIAQCTGGDETADGVDTSGVAVDAEGTADGTAATDAAPAPTPTPDEAAIAQQNQLNQILAEYPGVTGSMVSGVAILDGTVPDQLTLARLDGAVRDAGLSPQNNVQVDASAAAAEPVGYSLSDLIAAQPQLATLQSLLDQAGLSGALDGNGSFTLIAPIDSAFDALGADLDALRADPEALTTYLQYHVLSENLSGADISSRQSIESLSGESIDVTVSNGALRLNDTVEVLVADAEGRNGIMHIVNGVLVPPSLQPVPEELAEALSLNPITFAPGSSQLTDAGRVELDKVVAFLTETPVDVQIGGHTDSDGDEALNQRLSQERADAVLTYLTSQGVPADSLTAIGFGETQPIADNDTNENKARNRRIEFVTG